MNPEEAKQPVAQPASDSSTDQSSAQPSADLGANEWLVEEMRERYDADPGSVGPEWARYFESNGSPAGQEVTTPTEPAAAPEKPAGQRATDNAPKVAPAKAP